VNLLLYELVYFYDEIVGVFYGEMVGDTFGQMVCEMVVDPGCQMVGQIVGERNGC
jgi:hypothetical protein